MNEDQEISCNFFNHQGLNPTSGLKPSKFVFSQSSTFLSNPKHIHSISKVDQSEANKNKTSLKRQKLKDPPIIEINRTASFKNFPSSHLKNMNDQSFTLKESQPIITPIFKIQQDVVSLEQQKVNYVKKEAYFLNERNEEMNKELVRKNEQPIMVNFNTIGKSGKHQSTKINIRYENQVFNQSNTIPSINSKIQIPSENRISRVEEFRNEHPAGKSRRSSSSTQKGYRKDRHSMTPRQPFTMMLKEIESLVDENDLHDDISEVIGRGWHHDEDSFDFVKEKEFIYETHTHPTSSSNIKNSSVESAFERNSHLQNFN